MAAKKSSLGSLFKTGVTRAAIELWDEDYQALFQPDRQNLLKRHKVPKVKNQIIVGGNEL